MEIGGTALPYLSNLNNYKAKLKFYQKGRATPLIMKPKCTRWAAYLVTGSACFPTELVRLLHKYSIRKIVRKVVDRTTLDNV
jgi:hypothetical protein